MIKNIEEDEYLRSQGIGIHTLNQEKNTMMLTRKKKKIRGSRYIDLD